MRWEDLGAIDTFEGYGKCKGKEDYTADEAVQCHQGEAS